MGRIYFSNRAFMVPLTLAASLFLTAQAPSPEPVTDQETELGDAVYKDLKGKAMIIAQSPLYESLKPITRRSLGLRSRTTSIPSSSFWFMIPDRMRSPFLAGASTSRTLFCIS